MDEDIEQFQLKRLDLHWRHFYVNATINKKWLKNGSLHPLVIPQTMDCIVGQLTTMVAGERITEIRYPLNWWQAFRERWFPRFWLSHWPVRYHVWKIDFLYPDFDMREVQPTIAIYDSEKSPGFPHFEEGKSA